MRIWVLKESELLSELSKETLGSYNSKAASRFSTLSPKVNKELGRSSATKKDNRDYKNRRRGMVLSLAKLQRKGK